MAKITRTSVIEQCRSIAGINEAVESSPSILGSIVSPTLDLNPRFTNLLKFNSATATGNSAVYVTPIDKDCYITFASLSYKKDAACDLASVAINFVQNGATVRLLTMELVTAVQLTDNIVCSFPYPIKVDRGTQINSAGTFAAGTCTKTVMIGIVLIE
jgi:hypothetical protein